MRKEEQKMWDRLRPQLQALGVKYDRVESPATAPDFPDLAYTWGRRHGFIEFKATEIDDKGRLDLRHFTPGQRRWLRNRSPGGATWLLIRVYAPDEMWLVLKGTFAFSVADRPTLLDIEPFTYLTLKGGVTAEWLRQWLLQA